MCVCVCVFVTLYICDCVCVSPPEAVSPGGSCSVADERVIRVGDPEGGWDLIGVEEAGGASSEDAKVTQVSVVGLNTVLLCTVYSGQNTK